jgi:hypothetical protein
MYVIREVLRCKPGQVRELLEKFRALSAAVEQRGRAPLRLLTDVSGERFWTLVVEIVVETVDEFFVLERTLMEDAGVRAAMSGYHDVVAQGCREIYRLEA